MSAALGALRRNWLLLAILALAAAIRYAGLGQGFPVDYHWDERIYFHESLYALANGLRRESTVSANLPYLLIPAMLLQWAWLWLSGQAAGFEGLVRSYIEQPGPFMLLGRAIWAGSGVLSVLWAYRIGRRVGDERIGLLGAFFCAGAFLHVAESHFIKNDVPAGLFLLLALERCFDIAERGGRRDYFWAGFWVGLAAATKYYAAVTFLVVLLAHFPQPAALLPAALRERFGWQVERVPGWRLPGLALLGALLAFTLTTPVLIIDPQNLWDNVSYELGARFGSIPTDGSPQWMFYITEHLNNGLGMLLLQCGIIGLGLMLWRQDRRKILFVAMPVLFFLAVNTRPNNFARYMVPAVPFLCIAAGYLVRFGVGNLSSLLVRQARMVSMEAGSDLLRRLTGATVVRRATAGLLLAAALLVSWQSWDQALRYDRYALAPDSRGAAQAWIEANVAPGASMVIEGGESFSRTSNLGPQVRPTAEELEERGPNSPQEAFFWSQLRATAPDHPGYQLNLVGAVARSPQEINGQRVTAPVQSVDFWGRPDYFVLISWRSDYLRPGSSEPFWASLNAGYTLAATFPCTPCFPEDYYAWRIDYPTLRGIPLDGALTGGPEVRIFRRNS